jgi:hypothetical protein
VIVKVELRRYDDSLEEFLFEAVRYYWENGATYYS